ncbi:hypothetical protein GCM10027343_33900 [Noviherbaspirillum agri]
MIGWFLQLAPLVLHRPNSLAFVFSAALCFALAGVALLLPSFAAARAPQMRSAIGWGLIAIAMLSLFGAAVGMPAPVDLPSLHAWLHDINPRPGTMAVNTAIVLLLAGFVFAAMAKVDSRATGTSVLMATFAVLILGIGGVAANVLELELVYPQVSFLRMEPQSAVATIVLAIGLWNAWRHDDWYRSQRFFRDDEKTGYMSATILSATALTAGVAGFGIQQDILKSSLSENLMARLKNQVSTFHAGISQGTRHADNIARQTDVIRYVRAARKSTGFDRPQEARHRLGDNLLAEGFTSVTLYDNAHRELLHAGRPPRRAPLEKNVLPALPAWLRWDDGLYLGTRSPVRDNDRVISMLEAEQPLPLLSGKFMHIEGFGKTGEMGVCFADGTDIRCFPQGRNPRIHSFPRLSASGKLTAMGHALMGQSGIFTGRDYRGIEVIAAYAPLTETGLAIVIKQDAHELYQPIRTQLNWYLPLLVLLVAGGAWMLRSEVKPLVSKLLDSEQTARERELHVRTVVDTVTEGIITIDKDGVIESFNRAASRIFGYTPEQAIGRKITMLMPPEMRPLHDEGMQRYLTTGEARVIGKRNLELPGLHKDGTVFPLELGINETAINGRRVLVGIVQDRTERKKAEQALRESEARSREITETLGEGVFVTGPQGEIVFSNPAAQRLLGWAGDELQGKRAHALFHHTRADGTPYPGELCEINRVVSSGKSFRGHDEVFWRKDGTMLPVSINSMPIIRDGEVMGAVVAFHDIIERKRAEARMQHLANFDILTDLPNRALLRDRMRQALASAQREKHCVAVMFIDLDKFKPVNDRLGHEAGDQLLMQVAKRLRGCLRESDTVARVGGDEFVVLLPKVDGEDDALLVASKILDTLNAPFVLASHTVEISGSIGVAVYPEHGSEVEKLMKSADEAMYHAKQSGGSTIRSFSQLALVDL